MRLTPKLATAFLFAALAPATLTACGGGGASTSSTVAQGGSGTTTTAAPAATTRAAAKPSGTPHSSRSSAKQKGSASFRVPSGDNSIPDFGSEAASAERNGAGAALAAFLRARAKGDWSAACTYLTTPTRTQFEMLARASKGRVKGCGAVLAALSGRSPAAARADVFVGGLASLRVKGARAFALFYGPHDQQYMMPMAEESGRWLVAQLAPSAYPLGTPTPPTG